MNEARKSSPGLLQPFVDRGALAGAVTLVASKDSILNFEAVGWADIAAGREMRTDSIFWIASISKPISGAAFMMLVDEGAVALDEPVEKYIPEFGGQMWAEEQDEAHMLLKKVERPITLRQVLSHTSGLPFWSRAEERRGHRVDTLSLREAALCYAMSPLRTQPGTKYEYANSGINTAGRVIEVITKMPFEHFLQERLFGPLGMKDSTFVPTSQQLQRLAKAYKPAADGSLEQTRIEQLSYPLDNPERYPSPGGGLFSTAADVACFFQMIMRGGEREGRRYLSTSAVREMTGTQTGSLVNNGDGEAGYGIGFGTTRRAVNGGPAPAGSCGHGGAYSTDAWVDIERGRVSVFMVQHAGFPKDGNQAHPTFRSACAAV